MASPCEVLMDIEESELAEQVLQAVADEAWRIERKFSRYRDDNIIYRINNAQGDTVRVDEETARLIDFAQQLHQLSDGMFDITSGVLRRVWRFDGSDQVPTADQVEKVLQDVGWSKVDWSKPAITLLPGMEIDLGGIGKEYAVDSSASIVRAMTSCSVLINFGGDLVVTTPRSEQRAWSVGRLVTGKDQAVALFELFKGAIATSGDAHRYLLKDGVRYSHVLDPRNGMSVAEAPHTVSVAAPTCVEAGMFSTLAMLHGKTAAEFLDAQGLQYWID